MEAASATDSEALWFEPDPASLRCLVCGSDFLKRPVIRTFLVGTAKDCSRQGGFSKLIHVEHLETDLLLFDRHLECLISSKTTYNAVSHVWHPDISRVQQVGRRNNDPDKSSRAARQLALELPIRLFQGATGNDGRSIPGETHEAEFWHDYISVPQWTPVLKDRILGAIHDIFASASSTIVHFDDISPATIHSLYHGTDSADIVKALTDVCNARWYSRVWTAMEFVRSGTVRMMLDDYSICPDSTDAIFLVHLNLTWGRESKKAGGMRALERRVKLGTGKTLVPWNLGLLVSTKAQTHARKRCFAQSLVLLSRRGCREDRDFLYALRGLLADNHELAADTAIEDFETEYYRLARRSIERGDFSPLLIIPSLSFIPDPRTFKSSPLGVGYCDVFTWGAGLEVSPPDFLSDVSVSEDADPRTIRLRLQPMGIVSTVHRLNECHGDQRLGLFEAFGECAYIASQYTGPDVGKFVSSLASRLYGSDSGKIMHKLVSSNRLGSIQKLLGDRYASPGAGVWQGPGCRDARHLADTLGLTKPGSAHTGDQSAMEYCGSHGGTLHGAVTRLNCLIGVTCLTCHETNVFRVASFVNLVELRHAKAYRITGLKYDMTDRDGVALLERDGRVVGRMIWATPACPCRSTEMVKLRMPDLPPRPSSTSV